LVLAQTIKNQEGRDTLVQMARTWVRLAEEQERAAQQQHQQQQQIRPKNDKKE
jgi:cob(I)alamin adenosyltransferase